MKIYNPIESTFQYGIIFVSHKEGETMTIKEYVCHSCQSQQCEKITITDTFKRSGKHYTITGISVLRCLNCGKMQITGDGMERVEKAITEAEE